MLVTVRVSAISRVENMVMRGGGCIGGQNFGLDLGALAVDSGGR